MSEAPYVSKQGYANLVTLDRMMEKTGLTEKVLMSWKRRHWSSGVQYVEDRDGNIRFSVAEFTRWCEEHAGKRLSKPKASTESRLKNLPTSLYRHFDADGNLLYVGISLKVLARIKAHNRSHWWRDIATITIEHFPTRTEAEKREVEAIKSECPRHNKTHATQQ